ncbi:MAG: hypothetical protein MUC72_08080 [Acidobacteria bacterium]|jgi:hypothetical protein|nr:hypothetical protein [Acidobacteriota bacterium]
MEGRRGEKIGWTGGWLGSFLWVLVLSVMFLFQGRRTEGIVGVVLVGLGAYYIHSCAPWRSPGTSYWKLMLRVYAVLLASVAWAIWSFGGWEATGLKWWNLLWLLPVLMPLLTIGRRTWDGLQPEPQEKKPGQ